MDEKTLQYMEERVKKGSGLVTAIAYAKRTLSCYEKAVMSPEGISSIEGGSICLKSSHGGISGYVKSAMVMDDEAFAKRICPRIIEMLQERIAEFEQELAEL